MAGFAAHPPSGDAIGRSGHGRLSLRFFYRRWFDLLGGSGRTAIGLQRLDQPRAQSDGDLRLLLQKLAGLVAPLANALTVELVPCARLLEQTVRRPEIDQLANRVDAGAIADLELRLLERRGDLVLHDLHPHARSDHLV